MGLALAKIEEVRPDLIISSLEITEGSALEFVKKIKAHAAQIPSIFLSEPHLVDIETKLMQTEGGLEVVSRSQGPIELIKKIEHVVTLTRDYRRA